MLPKVCRMNPKNLVFALLKTFPKQAGRNSGRILRLFNCNDKVDILAFAGSRNSQNVYLL